jgi:excisionase family DNA binding protein
MSPKLPKNGERELVPIGQAANFLGVSIDTVRRWETAGKISSIRLDGKNRYFSLAELRKYKKARPLKVSEAAKKLGVSPSTLRRREKEGLISPVRGKKGQRFYSKEAVELLAKSKKKSIVSKPPSIPRPPKKEFARRDFVSPKPFTPRKIPWGAMSFAIVLLISIWALVVNPAPRQKDYSQVGSSEVLGVSVKSGLSGLFTRASSFFDRLALRFSDKWITNINDIFEFDEDGNLIPKVSFNLSKEDLEEMKGEEKPGDFVTFSENNTILALRVLSSNLVSGAVIGGEAGIILDSSITSYDIADEAITSLKIKNGTIVNADLSDGVINSAKIEDGSITTSDLSSSLTFSDQDLINLSEIDHSDTSQQGLILPNVSSATPVSPVMALVGSK